MIELAGDAANGARGHVGLTTDAPVDLVKAFREKFVKKYNYVPDHNGIKGYLAIYMIKAATEKMGKVDSKAFADDAARPDHQGRRRARHPDGRDLR